MLFQEREKTKMIKFSVIVPVYNSEKYLDRCLYSIYKQEYNEFEVIIIDDGSSDGSRNIIKKYQRIDSRFKCWSENNKGPALARDLGLRESKGDYICFIDSDDELLPNYFADINKALVQRNLSILEINAFYQEENKRELKKYQHLNLGGQIMSGIHYMSKYLGESNYFNVVPWTKIVNRNFILNNNLLFKDFYAEDELWARELFVSAPKVMFLDKCLYLQHRHNDSQSQKKRLKQNVEDQKKILYELEKLYRQRVDNINDLNVLLDELSHNFIAVSVLNEKVKVNYKDKLFALRNAKSLKNILNALLFAFSPELRKAIKEG